MKEGRFGLFAPIKVNSKSHSSLLATMMGSVVAFDSTVFKLDSNASFTKKSDRQTLDLKVTIIHFSLSPGIQARHTSTNF